MLLKPCLGRALWNECHSCSAFKGLGAPGRKRGFHRDERQQGQPLGRWYLGVLVQAEACGCYTEATLRVWAFIGRYQGATQDSGSLLLSMEGQSRLMGLTAWPLLKLPHTAHGPLGARL